MSTKRIIPQYRVNPKRDTQYDAALREHLHATKDRPGRTHTHIARDLALGDPGADRAYGLAIMYALTDFAQNDDSTICWYPNLRLKEKDLEKKRAKNKYNNYGLKLYKHAPKRKLIDREPHRTDEIIQGLIMRFITAMGPRSVHAIFEALKGKLGHVARSVVERCLSDLAQQGALVTRPVRLKNQTLYELPPK